MPQKPQAAPDFIPAEQSPDFIPDQGQQAQPASLPSEPSTPEQPGFLKRLGEALGIPTTKDELNSYAQHAHTPMGMVEFSNPAVGVGESIYNYGKGVIHNAKDAAHEALEAGENIGEGGPILPNLGKAAYGATRSGIRSIPLIGNSAENFGEDIAQHNYPGAAGGATGIIAPMLLGGGADKVSEAVTPKMLTPEVGARELTKAINPAVNEWPNYIKGTQAEAGNIIDYAKRNNIPLKTQLDYAKAARGSAQEASDHFKNQVLGPIAKENVSVSGSGYQGKGAGQASASLGDINKRITDINDELRSAYNKREAGQTRTALASEPELKAEQKSLTDILHNEIAKRTGLAPDQVAGLRQRIGRQFSIADQTDAAVNQRESSAGKAIEGRRDIPINKSGIMKSIVDYARGGPEGISDRRFSRIIPRMMVPSEPLPDMSGAMLKNRIAEVTGNPPRVPLWNTQGAIMQNRIADMEPIERTPETATDRRNAPFMQRNIAKAEAAKAKYSPSEIERSGKLLPAKTGPIELPAIPEENNQSSSPADYRVVRDPRTGQMKRQYLNSAGGSRKQ